MNQTVLPNAPPFSYLISFQSQVWRHEFKNSQAFLPISIAKAEHSYFLLNKEIRTRTANLDRVLTAIAFISQPQGALVATRS